MFNNRKIKALQLSLDEANNQLAKQSDLKKKLEILTKNFGVDILEDKELAKSFKKASQEAEENFNHVSSYYRSPKELAVLLGSMPDQVIEVYYYETGYILETDFQQRMTCVYNQDKKVIEHFYGFGSDRLVFKNSPEEFVVYNEEKNRIFALRNIIEEQLPARKYNLQNLLGKLYE